MVHAPPDIAHLMQEVLAELGFDADPVEIAKRVRKLNYGLPAEDEFSVICSWLGCTKILHKLDQSQIPLVSRLEYQVPDLIAMFNAGGPVLIEVKHCNDRTLSFKPDYYKRLDNYAKLMEMPLLIAWKFYSIWMLFEFRHMKIAKKNFNVSLEEGMRENLMGVLAGDVAFKLTQGSGIHFDFVKEEFLERKDADDGYTETWRMRVKEVHFSSEGGKIRTDLHPETMQLLAIWDLEEREEHSTTQIRKSFFVGAEGLEYAHCALVRLIEWENNRKKDIAWRGFLKASEITRTVSNFRLALERALSEGVVHLIIEQVPITKPDFLV